MSNRHKPIGNNDETLLRRYDETSEVAENKTVVIRLFRSEVASLKNTCGLQNELCSHPYVKHSPINIRDALYGGRTEASNTYYSIEECWKIHYVNVISLYPYICKHGKFPSGHPKVTWVLTVFLTVRIGSVSSNVRFCHQGNCIIRFFRTKATPN
jgi:hypothetical protein